MKSCFVVPNYNHGGTIIKVLEQLEPYQLPCFVVDDGSNDDSLARLAAIEKTMPWVEVITLEKNQGKGAALIKGFRHAHSQGFTHALQIDADAQHDFSDISAFLNASTNDPLLFISGCPVYDHSVPKNRLYGRKVAHFWVAIETWSLSIKDAMCGFRVYPLAATVAALDKYQVMSLRMGFDIEIIVYLYWENVPMKFIPTKVIYPENGISHYRLWHDNVLITKMHAKLFFMMIVKIPMLFKKKLRHE